METRISQALLSESFAAKEARFGRMIWSVTVANGAAALAFLNIVANADKPDAALQFFTVPLMLCGVGLSSGAGAGLIYSRLGERELDIMTDLSVMESVSGATAGLSVDELHQAALLIEGRAGVNGGDRPKNLTAARDRLEDAIGHFNRQTAKKRAEKERHFKMINWRNSASLWALSLAGMWIFFAFFTLQWRIQPSWVHDPRELGWVSIQRTAPPKLPSGAP